MTLPETAGAASEAMPGIQRILLTLDHTTLDRLAVARPPPWPAYTAPKLYLLHVEEGVTSQVYGPDASTAEVEAGEHIWSGSLNPFAIKGSRWKLAISHSSSPKKEIVRYATEIQPDLVIMGAHGHGGLKDLIFGTTINPVRHKLGGRPC